MKNKIEDKLIYIGGRNLFYGDDKTVVSMLKSINYLSIQFNMLRDEIDSEHIDNVLKNTLEMLEGGK